MVKRQKTESPAQTKKIASGIAKNILEGKLPPVVALEGELGAGKTTFLQGLAESLNIKEKILSPTFVIMKKFKIPEGPFSFFYHLDCYRVGNSEEVLGLGFREIIRGNNIVAIEWADKIKEILPQKTLKLKFDFLDRKTREIKYSSII